MEELVKKLGVVLIIFVLGQFFCAIETENTLPIVVVIGAILGSTISYITRYDDTALDRNIKDKIRELPPLFRRAQKNIEIVTDFDYEFFDHEEVKSSIETAVKKGCKVRILFEKTLYNEPPKFYKDLQEEGKIEIKETDRVPRHIMVIDECHVRLEKPHPGRAFGDKRDIAIIYKGFPQLGKRYSEEVDKLWTQLS